MTDNPTYRCWSLEGHHGAVQCDLKVLNTLGAAAREGFMRFPHGGAEVGGILLGTLQGDTVQIVETRPLPIEYARGASFVLSESDAEALRRLIRTSTAEVVGWYVSHTRRDLAPNASDMAIYDGFFSKPWQVYMIIKPDKLDDARMAVFSRGEDGGLLEYSTHHDIADETPSTYQKEPTPEPRLEAPPPLFTPPLQPTSTRRYWLGALVVSIGAGAAWFASSGHKQAPAVPAPAAPITAPAQPVTKPEPPPPPQIQAESQRERKAKRVRSRHRRRPKKSKASQP